ncbi:MAG: C-terminal binding protein [Chloroflexi bacterium]|nr:C-terminal binding protein [Chloroflexota bacterium]
MAAIVATDPGDLPRPAVEELRARGHTVDVLGAGLDPVAAAVAARDATVILCGIVGVPAAAVAELRATRLIMRCGAGVDTVDLAATAARGIWVANVPDYCLDEVADHTLLLLLAAMRRLRHMEQQVAAGRWLDPELPVIRRLAGRTLGLVGVGRIGERVATRAHGFGLRVIAHDPGLDPTRADAIGVAAVDLEVLLASSDIVSLHLPLTPATHHLLDATAFAAMRPGTVLVNTSRGGLVDLDALAVAVEDGTIGACGLDVLDGEPHPPLDHPLLRDPRVIVTPHVAFYSVDAQADLGRRVADEVERALAGLPPTSLVTPSTGQTTSPTTGGTR